MDIEKNSVTSHNITQQTLDPLQDGISSIDLVRVSGSDVDIVNAARVSYGKFVTELTEKDTALIKFLLIHEHTSPFEHNQLSFRIKAPIFVVRQWMRHRMNSYNEISYRYVKAPLEFYVPPYFRYQDVKNKQASVGAFKDDALADQYLNLIKQSVSTYESLLENGVCRELARGVLPLCTYTQFIFTTNLHSLMHFMRLRLHAGAQHEIRMFAQGLLYLAKPHFSISLQIWQEKYKDILSVKEDLFTQQFTKAVEK
ncbi:MAG TPA: FAD-dependent thymidylate synthase [Patescibacteria group bacterium]|jgi:thymidylate synthase (FAD)|nr:FAD-dependent thymidylate synthase [Patescibacteria group bacterium]